MSHTGRPVGGWLQDSQLRFNSTFKDLVSCIYLHYKPQSVCLIHSRLTS